MELKKVALNHIHEELGAKMVPFAGYNMPVRYASDIAEHKCVRNGVGMFDVSHMGEFKISGPNALDLIQKVSSNDASMLVDGKVQYSCLPNDRGGIVDDLLVYRFNETEYMLVVNASNIQKDWSWIESQNTMGAQMVDISDQTSLLAVQGPQASNALQSLTEVDLAAIAYYTFRVDQFAGIDKVIISATGYTGSGGFELYTSNENAVSLWNAVMHSGEAFGLQPIGLGARDTLRLEAGFCLYGNDIDDETSPLEAGLGWITKFTKDFVNSKALKAQKEAGISKKLVGIEMIERGIPRSGYVIKNLEGSDIGKITSGTMSPMRSIGIGLGYIEKESSGLHTEVLIEIRNKNIKARIVRPPFYKN